MFRYYIINLNSLEQDLLEELDTIVKVVFPNSMTLSQIKQEYTTVPFSVFFVKNEGQIIYCSLILSSHPTLYIYYICVPKKFRSSGVFKRALRYLKHMYSKNGFTSFALDASEESDPNMNQQKRLVIFSSLGFRLSKLKNKSPFKKHDDPKTYVVTLFGKGQLLEQQGDRYVALINGEKKALNLKQIKGCVSDMMSENPDICPMIMKLNQNQRNTRKASVKG
jgi:hypothetical protein